MKRVFVKNLFIILLLLLLTGCEDTCPKGFQPVVLPEFMLGFSQTPSDVISISQGLGFKYLRWSLSWRGIEPVVETRGLTVDLVRENPGMVADYINQHDWSDYDSQISTIIASGLEPFVIVGHGYTGALSTVDGLPASPDRLGRDDYLGHMYLYTRATVERYDADGYLDAPESPRINYWQTENELNQAFLTAMWGWRDPSLIEALGSAWQDWVFVTEILKTLRLAVKDADTSALTTVNFHTDIAFSMNRAMLQPTWVDAIIQWRQYIDIIGLDAYPNYYQPYPVNGGILGERVLQAKEHSCEMPIVIMETGYPTGPAIEGFDEAGQAQYIRDAFGSAYEAGINGYFHFGARTPDYHTVEITDEDLQNLSFIAGAYEEGNLWKLGMFILFNLDYMQNHFVQVIQAVEPYWGVVRPDGSLKPGWYALEEISRTVYP